MLDQRTDLKRELLQIIIIVYRWYYLALYKLVKFLTYSLFYLIYIDAKKPLWMLSRVFVCKV